MSEKMMKFSKLGINSLFMAILVFNAGNTPLKKIS